MVCNRCIHNLRIMPVNKKKIFFLIRKKSIPRLKLLPSRKLNLSIPKSRYKSLMVYSEIRFKVKMKVNYTRSSAHTKRITTLFWHSLIFIQNFGFLVIKRTSYSWHWEIINQNLWFCIILTVSKINKCKEM